MRTIIIRCVGCIWVLLLLFGCAHRPQQVQLPKLLERKCPENSIEYNGVNYCTDPPACTHKTLMNNGELCMAIDPVTKRPLGLFFKGDSCNPFTEQDCDAPDKKKGKPVDD